MSARRPLKSTHRAWTALVVAHVVALAAPDTQAGTLSADLQQAVATAAPGEEIAVIVQLADRENLAAYNDRRRDQRLKRIVRALKDRATRSQAPVTAEARSLGGRDLKQLWTLNAVALKLPAARVARLAANPAVRSLRLDSLVDLPGSASGTPAPAAWNLSTVKAPELWALGHTGGGIVIGSLDTGVDALHPDLSASYRGGSNSWFDPHGEHASPHDAAGHGTQTMGIMVGGSSGGASIGMAPGARWIAVKQFNDAGTASYSQIHLGFQWMLDPDANPDTDDAPHVVNASWGFGGATGQCITEFSDDIQMLRAAGIAVVFSAGNDGPTVGSSVSPANNAQVFSVGAVNDTLTVADFSSRGPSGCDGTLFPSLVAPGVNVVTSDLSFGGLPLYMNVAGTSFAAPHASGAMALLAGAFPNATVAQLEEALRGSAAPVGVGGTDNSYGHGVVDVLAAYQALGGNGNSAPQITSTPTTTATQGQAWSYDVQATDPQGDVLAYALTQYPAGMTIDSASGLINWTPAAGQGPSQAVTVRVSDPGGLQATQTFTLSVLTINRPPVAQADSFMRPASGSLVVGAPGVLANDQDPDGDALTVRLVAKPSKGTLTLAADGSFSFKPPSGKQSALSFTYQAADPAGTLSAVTTVTLAPFVNLPPVAQPDSYTAPARTGSSYAAQSLAVLANDSDPDSAANPANAISPSTLSISVKPSKGGSASVVKTGAAAGTISYKPKTGFKGVETFSYKVKDTSGGTSNAAVVTVTVN